MQPNILKYIGQFDKTDADLGNKETDSSRIYLSVIGKGLKVINTSNHSTL